MPRILLIQPTLLASRDRPVPFRIRKRKIIGAVLPYLAALVPPDWDVLLHDDAIEEPDYEARVDAVGLTVRTVTSFRAYQIADTFRKRGVPVIMGGPHATFHAEEMLEHADAVCVGEAEEVFPRMLRDLEAGRLAPIYRRDTPANLRGLPTPRWDLLKKGNYAFYSPVVIQHSRGCPYACDFCAERRLNGDFGYRFRPVEDIVREIELSGKSHVFFAASQFVGNRVYTRALLEALIPLRIRWSALFSAHFCLDEAFLDLAKRSGLLHVNMGVESINEKTLKAMNKTFNHVHDYVRVIRNLKKRGISFSFNFVIGADEDDPSVFGAIYDFLTEHRVDAAYFNVMAPLRGTPLYARLKAEGRLIDEANMDRWPGVHCHFVPKNFTPEALVAGVKELQRRFYSARSMARRLPLPLSEAALASWQINLLERRVARNAAVMNEFEEF
jgi:radical SAM superfamily enzyme YgiQ (UPF0313 family)